MSTHSKSDVRAALVRWVAALNGRGHRTLVTEALARGAVVERVVPGFQKEAGGELHGMLAVARWMKRTPEDAAFSLDRTAIALDGEEATARWTLRLGAFTNHGRWTVQLAEDGRIRRIVHAPDPLPEPT